MLNDKMEDDNLLGVKSASGEESSRLSKSMVNLCMAERMQNLQMEPALDHHNRIAMSVKKHRTDSTYQVAWDHLTQSSVFPATSVPSKSTTLPRDSPGYASRGDVPYTNGALEQGHSLPAQSVRALQDKRTVEDRHTRTHTGPEETYGFAECSVCLEEFQEEGRKVPRNLQCGHTFCTGCLEQLLENLKPSSGATPVEIGCPVCHTPTQIDGRDVGKLPKNYGLLEVIGSNPSSYMSRVGRLSIAGRGDSPTAQKNEVQAAIFCPDHGDHLSSYCVKDNTLVCSSCLLYGNHKQHKCLLVTEAAKIGREKLQQLNPEVLGQKKRLEEALVDVKNVMERVQTSGGRLVDEMNACFDDLVQFVEERRRRLKLETMERTQVRVQALLEQARDIRECIENASMVYSSSQSLLKSDDFTMLKGASLALERIESVFINPPPTSPRANDDLAWEFSDDVREEIVSHLGGYGNLRPIVGTVSKLYLQPYHDGIRISWESHNLADNQGISYHLQMASRGEDYVNIYRGGNTKFTWKTDLDHGVRYQFRVQVRTTEGVGNWSKPQETMKAAPFFHWHDKWRSVKIELSPDKLEASWSKGGVHHYWATFGGDLFFVGGEHYFEIEIIDLGKLKPKKKLAIGVIGCGRDNLKNIPWHDGRHAVGQWREFPSWSFHPISGVISSSSLPLEGKEYAHIALQNGDRIGVLANMEDGKLTFFCNGQDLGVAFDDVQAETLLPAVSIRDKIRVRLRFPPPPYSKRTSKLIHISSTGRLSVS